MQLSRQSRLRSPASSASLQDWQTFADELQERVELREGEIEAIPPCRPQSRWPLAALALIAIVACIVAFLATYEGKKVIAAHNGVISQLNSLNAQCIALDDKAKKADADVALLRSEKASADSKAKDADKTATDAKMKLADAQKAKVDAEQKLAEAQKTPPIDVAGAIADAVARVKAELKPTQAPTPNIDVRVTAPPTDPAVIVEQSKVNIGVTPTPIDDIELPKLTNAEVRQVADRIYVRAKGVKTETKSAVAIYLQLEPWQPDMSRHASGGAEAAIAYARQTSGEPRRLALEDASALRVISGLIKTPPPTRQQVTVRQPAQPRLR